MSSATPPDATAAREEVTQCEQEIQNIKDALRRLSSSVADEPNSLQVVLLKVEGLPAAARPSISIQLSSPIEEQILTKIFDPSTAAAAADGSSVAIFKEVETNMATLAVTAKDADIPLGDAAPQELAPICAFNPMQDVKEEYVTELSLPIMVPSGASTAGTEASTSTTSPPTTQPVCTVTLRITYRPSQKDKKEELYELLNAATQRKTIALDNLRKLAVARSGQSPAGVSSSRGAMTRPSVKPGFLNKKKAKESTMMEKAYDRIIGPNSMLIKGVGIAWFAKNYIIFFGAVSFFHFKGQMLSLPPPV